MSNLSRVVAHGIFALSFCLAATFGSQAFVFGDDPGQGLVCTDNGCKQNGNPPKCSAQTHNCDDGGSQTYDCECKKDHRNPLKCQCFTV